MEVLSGIGSLFSSALARYDDPNYKGTAAEFFEIINATVSEIFELYPMTWDDTAFAVNESMTVLQNLPESW
jgi:hypothetical protein